MFRKARIKWASKCGSIEHKAGRWLGLLTFMLVILSILTEKWIFINKGTIFISSITFITWAVYLISHTLEKKVYGKHGFR